ncbi:hypothetical protein DL765_010980 [Monosporascus sp. GIB2]|nr:hypothetical protein DL765_010980 [Monosporascus sp. GIB2]
MPSSPDSVVEGSIVPQVPTAGGAPHTRAASALNQILCTLPRNLPNYRGDPGNAANQCANIPQSQSTCLFIANLPPGCTPAQLLGTVSRGVGKVWALSISPPTAQHRTGGCQTYVPGPHGDGPLPGDLRRR